LSTSFFFFNVPAPPEFYTLSLHDALPIFVVDYRKTSARKSVRIRCIGSSLHAKWIGLGGLHRNALADARARFFIVEGVNLGRSQDRKSTRLNSSHDQISYAVFCLKKKKNI